MKKTIIIFILPILIYSCNGSKKWDEFAAEGLPDFDEEYYELCFTDSLHGYLGGHFSDIDINDQTVLYETNDQGKSWTKLPLNYDGSVYRIFAFKDTLTVVLQGVFMDSVYVMKSIDHGQSWKKIFSTNRDIWIDDIYFNNSNHGSIVTGDKYLLELQNNAIDTILKLPNTNNKFTISENRVYSLIYSNDIAGNLGVEITTIGTGESKKLYFDKPYWISSSIVSGNTLLLAADYENSGKIIRVTDSTITGIDFGNYSNYLPDQIFAYGNTIAAVVSRREDASLIGVTHHFLISKDNGTTWTLEEMPNSMRVNPATMFKDQFFMSYSGVRKIQVRK